MNYEENMNSKWNMFLSIIEQELAELKGTCTREKEIMRKLEE